MSLKGLQGDALNPTVLLLYFVRDSHLETTERHLCDGLHEHTSLLQARNAGAALRYLSVSMPPQAIVVADANITDPVQAALIDSLVEYIRSGGRVVFCARFSTHFPHFDVAQFFRRFGMMWDRGCLSDATYALNPAGLPKPISGDGLVASFTAKSQNIKDIGTEAAVYLPEGSLMPGDTDPQSQEREFPAAFAPLGRGYVGYVGCSEGELAGARLVLEMCGVTSARSSETVSGGDVSTHQDVRVDAQSIHVPPILDVGDASQREETGKLAKVCNGAFFGI